VREPTNESQQLATATRQAAGREAAVNSISEGDGDEGARADQEDSARRVRGPSPDAVRPTPSHARRVAKVTFIGLVSLVVSLAIPVVVLVILAFIAQIMISGH
jgi:hypothetical protein